MNDFKNIKTIYYFQEEIIPNNILNIKKPIVMFKIDNDIKQIIKEYGLVIGILFY